MSRKTVLLFPGQGAYLPGALRRLTRQSPELARTFANVDAVASAAGVTSVSDADSARENAMGAPLTWS
jgi:[acyl-carrier-protein] S-malonyltransferase